MKTESLPPVGTVVIEAGITYTVAYWEKLGANIVAVGKQSNGTLHAVGARLANGKELKYGDGVKIKG
jgi:hypothetical protein